MTWGGKQLQWCHAEALRGSPGQGQEYLVQWGFHAVANLIVSSSYTSVLISQFRRNLFKAKKGGSALGLSTDSQLSILMHEAPLGSLPRG